MRRYRVLLMQFDARPNILSMKIEPTWEPHIQQQLHAARAQVSAELAAQYGLVQLDRKIRDFCELGAAPFSVISFHNVFYDQARSAFTVGAYYPALTAACALGERILNHLVLLFRDDFAATPEYRHVYRKDSFDNWDLAIDTLAAWNVLLPDAVSSFRALRDLRNRSLHFNPETDRSAREQALVAMRTLHGIIDCQFTVFGIRPWFIPSDTGISLVKKESERDPFVAKVLLPSCALVGPEHDLEQAGDGQFRAVDATVSVHQLRVVASARAAARSGAVRRSCTLQGR